MADVQKKTLSARCAVGQFIVSGSGVRAAKFRRVQHRNAPRLLRHELLVQERVRPRCLGLDRKIRSQRVEQRGVFLGIVVESTWKRRVEVNTFSPEGRLFQACFDERGEEAKRRSAESKASASHVRSSMPSKPSSKRAQQLSRKEHDGFLC